MLNRRVGRAIAKPTIHLIKNEKRWVSFLYPPYACYNEIYLSETIEGGFLKYAEILVHECAHKDDFSTGNRLGKNILYMFQVLNPFIKYKDRSAEKYAFDEQAAFKRDYEAWMDKQFRKKKKVKKRGQAQINFTMILVSAK